MVAVGNTEGRTAATAAKDYAGARLTGTISPFAER